MHGDYALTLGCTVGHVAENGAFTSRASAPLGLFALATNYIKERAGHKNAACSFNNCSQNKCALWIHAPEGTAHHATIRVKLHQANSNTLRSLFQPHNGPNKCAVQVVVACTQHLAPKLTPPVAQTPQQT
jgi:hypothetical protein